MNKAQKSRQRARDRAADGIAMREECVAPKDSRRAFGKVSPARFMSGTERNAYYKKRRTA